MAGQITLFRNPNMRRVAVVNHKGGTGKTTTAVHLAAGLADLGHGVLLVDLDPQGNVGAWFGLDESETRMARLLAGQIGVPKARVEVRENLDVIAGDWRLAETEERLIWGQERERGLTNRLAGIEGYDYVILDCAPSMSLLTTSALAYADEVIIPISMEYLALVGVRQIVDNILRMSARNGRDLRITAVVPTFYQQNLRKNRQILGTLKKHFAEAVTEPIRDNVRLSEAPSRGQTIFEYAPRSFGARDYRRLVERFVGG
ncbi:MAG: ParA family protein [Gemmatimonadales bacterium]|nr:ParA family protein [Gemmatimonadales bacterium]